MADHIRIRKAPGTWVVRAGGAVLGESANALELTEGDDPPVIYFPREDVGMAFLERTQSSITCPWSGPATYYTVSSTAGDIPDAAWSYEEATEAVAAIRGHIAFHTNRVTVEQL